MFSGPRSNRNDGKVKKKRRARPRRRLRTPAPVAGRKHIETQTSRYLEEIHVRPTEASIFTQTDPMLDYPEPPLFVPKPSGVCVATQIEEGDLFDFNLEVIPLLETLVGKALDIALMEACEEQELKALRQHQEMYEQRRNAELTECQRLQETERRLFEEKERRKQQARRFQEQKKKEERKLAAKLLVKEKQQDLKDITFARLQEKGIFGEEPLMKFISNTLMKEIYEQVGELLKPKKVSIAIVNALIEHVVESLLQKKMNAINTIKEEFKLREEKAAYLLKTREKYSWKVEAIGNNLNSIKDETYFGFEVAALLKEDEENIGDLLASLKESVSKEVLLTKLPIEGLNIEALEDRLEYLKNYEDMHAVRSSARKVEKMLLELSEELLPVALEELKVESMENFKEKFLQKDLKSTDYLLEILCNFIAQRTHDVELEENVKEFNETEA